MKIGDPPPGIVHILEEIKLFGKVKEKNMVARLSVEAKNRVITQTACEIIWLQSFMTKLGFPHKELMRIRCNN